MPAALAPVSRRSHRLIDRTMARAMQSIDRHTGTNRGWYPGGWAAPEVEWTFLGRDRTLRVRGTVPDEYPELRDQEIAVVSDDVEVTRVPVAGDFTLEVALPEAGDRRARRVRLEAQRWFVPRKAGINDDRRRLAYLLHELDARS